MTTDNGENLRSTPQFWQDALSDGRIGKLTNSTNMITEAPSDLCLVNAICDYCSVEGDNTFTYMLFAYKTGKSQPDGYKEVTVPAATWAVLRTENHTMKGTSDAIQSLIKRVYTEWLPTADYEKIDGYELELYYGRGSTWWSEAWFRVNQRNSLSKTGEVVDIKFRYLNHNIQILLQQRGFSS
ncbi:GyrI-like domain-containing protein [Paenibacillus dendritiformis]|uniref:GyrI-like domain-containing protein n=1 Tax=Paenibacillus dendritiformis TaxID=130049 RepID=UPI001C6554ED|nr:GyrI-like domain-containing protein [Paenibacillus dendritiformis]